MADYEMGNDVEYIFKKEMVVVLEFYILTPKSLTQGFLDANPVDESNLWFNNIAGALGPVGKLLRGFSNFALANANQENKGYLVKLSLVNQTNPDKIYEMSALVKGQLISQNFSVPPELNTPTPFGISHDQFRLTVPKGNKFVTGCTVHITDNIGFTDPVLPLPNNTFPVETIEREIVKMFPEDLADDEEVEVVVYDLSPGRAYSFRVSYLTEVGSSRACNESDGFWTAPVSAPTFLSAGMVSSDSIQLSWQPPDIIAEYLHINVSLISYRININGFNYNTSDLKYALTNLDPGTEYEVQVTAFIPDTVTNETLPDSSPSTISVYTVPLAPQNFQTSNVGEHYAELSWDSVENQADVLYYIVEYSNDAGGSWSYVVKDNKCKITNLSRGASYSFTVKVATSGGQSEPSAQLLVDTLFIKTEFEELREEWENSIQNLEYDARATSSFCSFKDSINDERISYNNIFLDNNNVDGASMDISTGIFIAGATASYQISANVEMRLAAGQNHDVWVVVNDIEVEGGRMSSSYDKTMQGILVDNGSKNLVLALTAGDKVYLAHHTNGEEPLTSVTYCISLIKIE